MKKILVGLALLSGLSLAGCTTDQAVLGGAAAGGAIGAASSGTVGGALVGAGIGALAGYVLVSHDHDGMCTYRYHHRIHRDYCR